MIGQQESLLVDVSSPDDLRNTINQKLLDCLPSPEMAKYNSLKYFAELIRDYPNRGGKTWRGLLTCYVSVVHGSTLTYAFPAAIAIELFQNWILLHDDIEDGSEYRRGTPTLHEKVGIPIALNVGNAMHALMWEILFAANYSSNIYIEFVELMKQTMEGQHIDLSWINNDCFDLLEEEYFMMVQKKGAYYTIVAPLRLGSLLADSEPFNEYLSIGNDLGVAYQLRDDVLNLVGEESHYGKEIGGDLWEGKRTLILLRYLKQASHKRREKAKTILRKPRKQKKVEEVKWLLEEIRSSGVIEPCQTLAEELTKSGLKKLSSLWRSFENKSSIQVVLNILEATATRKKIGRKILDIFIGVAGIVIAVFSVVLSYIVAKRQINIAKQGYEFQLEEAKQRVEKTFVNGNIEVYLSRDAAIKGILRNYEEAEPGDCIWTQCVGCGDYGNEIKSLILGCAARGVKQKLILNATGPAIDELISLYKPLKNAIFITADDNALRIQGISDKLVIFSFRNLYTYTGVKIRDKEIVRILRDWFDCRFEEVKNRSQTEVQV